MYRAEGTHLRNVAERNLADRRQEVKQHITCMG